MIYFYCRVSTQDKQEFDRQLYIMKQKQINPDKIYQEKMTGTKINRPIWSEMYNSLVAGDTVIVESLSRVARSTKDLLNVLYDLEKRKVTFISLKEDLDLSTPTGRLMAGIFSVVAQFERDIIAERVSDSLKAKKLKGVKLGRPINKPVHKLCLDMLKAGYNPSQIAKELNITRATVYNIRAAGTVQV